MHKRRLALSLSSNRVEPVMDKQAHVSLLKTVIKQACDSQVNTSSKQKSKGILRNKNTRRDKSSNAQKLQDVEETNNKKALFMTLDKTYMPHRMLDFWGCDTTKKNSTHAHMIRLSNHLYESDSEPTALNKKELLDLMPSRFELLDLSQSRSVSPEVEHKNNTCCSLDSKIQYATWPSRSVSPEIHSTIRHSRNVSPEVHNEMRHRRSVSPEVRLRTPTSSPDVLSGIPWGHRPSMYKNVKNRHTLFTDFLHANTRTHDTVLRQIHKDFLRSPCIADTIK